MAWASTENEFNHLHKIADQFDEAMMRGEIVGFQMKSGSSVAGMVLGCSIEREDISDDLFQIREQVDISLSSGQKISLNYLEIESVYSVSNKRVSQKLYQAG